MKIITLHRLSKAVIAASVSIFYLVVGYNNIVDFNTNFYFLQHVLSMDAMQPWFDSDFILHRSIHSHKMHIIFYWGIIIGELCAGVLGFLGAMMMLKNMHFNAQHFVEGQFFFLLSTIIAMLIWYFSFSVIGAEWFMMWANQWNAQMKAYTFSSFILLVMMYIIIPSPKEWSSL